MELVLGRLLAVVAVVAGTASCERRHPVVVGYAFGDDHPNVLDVVRARESTGSRRPEIVDATGMTIEQGPPGQVTMASRFAAYPGLVAVVGHGDSRGTLAAAPVYDEARIPLLVPTATSRRLRTISPWVFMLAPDDSAEAEFIATFVVQTLRTRTAAVFYDNDEYGVGLRDFLRTALAARGAGVLFEAPIAEAPIGSFCDAGHQSAEASLVRAMPRDRPPGVVIIAGRTPQAACIGRRVHERIAQTPIIGTDAVEPDSGFVRTIGPAASHFYVVAFWYPGIVGDSSAAFTRAYERVTGTTPHPGHAMLFDALSLVETAIRDVGGNRDAIRRYLAELGVSRPAYQGITGAIAFGSAPRPLYMLRVAPFLTLVSPQ